LPQPYATMEAPTHTYSTRASAAAAAAPPPRPASPPPEAEGLFTQSEVIALRNAPRKLQLLLREHQLLLSPGAQCEKCEGTLREHTDAHYTDGHRLMCSRCGGNFSIRHRSIFARSKHALFDLALLLACFDARILVHQAENLTGLNRKRIGEFYSAVRTRLAAYMSDHPIRFAADEIVEIDELYLKPLREPGSEEEKSSWPPVIGMVGRHSGHVALEIAPSHATRDIRDPILSHLPHRSTVVFTDEAASFNFLSDHCDYKKAWYTKRGGAKWLDPHREHLAHGRMVTVHSNTIESYWSQLRTWLHASHGWPADYLPLFLSECMFRSLHIPLSVPLRAV
jgi:hypothetical protein